MNARVVAATAAGAAVAIVLLAGTGLGWWGGGASARASAFVVRTSLSPVSTLYGDPVTATVSVSGDARALGSGPVIEPSFAPYAPLGPAAVTRSSAGRRLTVVYRYRLQCVTDACLPVDKPKNIVFPPVKATAGTAHATTTWPTLLVASRLTAAELAASKPPVRTATLPPATFRSSPGTLSALLVLAATLLALAAFTVAYLELAALMRARREHRPRLTGLALAIAYARDAAARPDPADRRRAAELLAETLRRDEPELADAAGAVAWSDAPPTTEQTLELVDAVEAKAGRA